MQFDTGRSSDPEHVLQDAEARLERRDVAGARSGFNCAEALGADRDRCAGGRWLASMLCGEFAAAWGESDAIRRRGAHDRHRFWNGETVENKRVIVRCLHGFGDAVQMLRYAPMLRARCAELIVEVPPRMIALASCFAGVDRVVTWGEQAPTRAPEWDVQVEVMELPYLFRTKVRELPIATRYLTVPVALGAQVQRTMGSRRAPRVGLVWASGEWNRSRSMPFEHVQAIIETSGLEFWNLQGGRESEDWGQLPRERPTRDANECGAGIATLAAVIEQLDLVITVDTLAAHLAGALGTPAWVLLQHAADWRWMVERTDTPWYPSLRLYRQAAQGEWPAVVRTVNRDLALWLASADRNELAG